MQIKKRNNQLHTDGKMINDASQFLESENCWSSRRKVPPG